MQCVREFDCDNTSICKFLSDCDLPFEQSPVYEIDTASRNIDTNVRRSVYRDISEEKLFDLVDDNILREVSECDATYSFYLRRDHASHIKYTQGGFFGRHQDYLAVNSNIVEEFAMLICVTPAELARHTRGGETIIHGYECSRKCRASATPGRGLIFRKDLEHEGAKLVQGDKHVLALNLWAVRKRSSTQVLLVDFVEDTPQNKSRDDTVTTEKQTKSSDAACECESALLAAAKQPAFAVQHRAVSPSPPEHLAVVQKSFL